MLVILILYKNVLYFFLKRLTDLVITLQDLIFFFRNQCESGRKACLTDTMYMYNLHCIHYGVGMIQKE